MRALSSLFGLATGAALAVTISTVIHHAQAQTSDPCAALIGAAFSNAKVESAEANLSGTLAGGRGPALTGLPSFCRVRGLATPAPRSRIHFEAWLPLKDWNGRIEMIGNSGYSSAINTNALATLVRQ